MIKIVSNNIITGLQNTTAHRFLNLSCCLKKKKKKLFYVDGLHIHPCSTRMPGALQRLKERCHIGVTICNGEPPCGLDPLEEQQVLLTSEPSLLSPRLNLKVCPEKNQMGRDWEMAQ